MNNDTRKAIIFFLAKARHICFALENWRRVDDLNWSDDSKRENCSTKGEASYKNVAAIRRSISEAQNEIDGLPRMKVFRQCWEMLELAHDEIGEAHLPAEWAVIDGADHEAVQICRDALRRANEQVTRTLKRLCARGYYILHRDQPDLPYLSIKIDEGSRTATRDELTANFSANSKAWALVLSLFNSGSDGARPGDLFGSIWNGRAVEPNNLNQQKGKANELLMPLKLSIEVGDDGKWRLLQL